MKRDRLCICGAGNYKRNLYTLFSILLWSLNKTKQNTDFNSWRCVWVIECLLTMYWAKVWFPAPQTNTVNINTYILSNTVSVRHFWLRKNISNFYCPFTHYLKEERRYCQKPCHSWGHCKPYNGYPTLSHGLLLCHPIKVHMKAERVFPNTSADVSLLSQNSHASKKTEVDLL